MGVGIPALQPHFCLHRCVNKLFHTVVRRLIIYGLTPTPSRPAAMGVWVLFGSVIVGSLTSKAPLASRKGC